MKTNNILAISIATGVILSFWVMWSYAYNSYNNNNYPNSNQSFLDNITKSDLTADEKDLILYQYNEEKVAYDLYNYFYELYWNRTFSMIANSENQHMKAVESLIERYSLETPTDYWVLQSTFDSLKLEWEKSLNDALTVWIKVEMLDIEDMVNAIKNTDNDDLKQVFLNIGWASYNHLRAFARQIDTDIDYSNYLSENEVNSRWNLSYKLEDRLIEEWISLPENNYDIPCQSSWNKYSNSWKWKWSWAWKWNWNRTGWIWR